MSDAATRPFKLDTQIYGFAGVAERTRELKAIGIDGIFTFEGPNDVFMPLTLAAAEGGIDLYSNLAVAIPRNPIQLAHQAWDLQTLSGGRFSLGLGSQIKTQVEKRYGHPFNRPVARMAEMVGALKAIFNTWQTGERLDFRGDFHTHTLMPPLFNPGPNEFGPPPILLGGLGPKMVEMVGTVADGLLVMPFCSERFFTQNTMVSYQRGLDASKRTTDDVTIVCESIICSGSTDEEMAQARDGVSMLLSFYGSTPSYRPVLEAHGWGDLQVELNAMTKSGRWDEMPALISDEVLHTLAVVGSPAEVGAELTRRFGGVADRVGFYFPYGVSDDTIAGISEAVEQA